MSTITTKDGTEIYYKDWGEGPVVTFSHGWPLSADAWDGQMLFLAQNGFHVVAHDRRGHGRSSQASSGNDMNGYADDLAAVIEALDLKDATLVGHSTGGGEVARYIGRHGTKRVTKAVLVAAVPPIMLKSAANPEGLPMEVFDNWRTQIDVKRPILRSRTMCSYKKVRANQTKGSQFPRDRWRCLIVSRKRIIAIRRIPGPDGCCSYPYSERRKTGISPVSVFSSRCCCSSLVSR